MPGPAPGQLCVVCNHPDRATIEASDGALSRREIARRWGVGKDSVNRHFHNGHAVVAPRTPDAPAPVAPEGDVAGSDPDEMGELDRLRRTRAVLVKRLERDPDPATAREVRQLSARIGELSAEHAPSSVGLQDVEGLAEQVARWFAALEAHPEAREAMLAATDPELLRAAGVEA